MPFESSPSRPPIHTSSHKEPIDENLLEQAIRVLELADQEGVADVQNPQQIQDLVKQLVESDKPKWHASRRILLWRGKIVKYFKREAPAQEAVLNAFETQAWRERIEDPLEPGDQVEPKERLRETVKSLNRGLTMKMIRFYADGTGRGIRWKRLI